MAVVASASAVVAELQSSASAEAAPELALQVTDFAALPITGVVDGTGNNAGSLARINFMREEPAPARRFFVNDLTGPLYIMDRATRKLTTYLDLNGRDRRTGLFGKLMVEVGLASGFISFQFDPDYARNGKFYTLHLEELGAPGTQHPDHASVPGLTLEGYAPTPPIAVPGPVSHEAVIVEWTDSRISDATFQGTARELMRIQHNTRIHPTGDLIFNPLARRGDPDWRVMYVACGDGGAGDQRSAIRTNGQRLDTVVGKILRIIPDLDEHKRTSSVSDNGRYRIPSDNPFASLAGARKEVWAYGLRNPHRLSWDVDPGNSANNHLIAANIGFRTWETVVIIHKGANYGFPEREGIQRLLPDNSLDALPDVDAVPVHLSDVDVRGTIVPTYPVAQYGHGERGGDAIAGGFVYRGKAVPELRGKYILGDISTGRLWWASFDAMLAVDQRHPPRLAALHELRVLWDDPHDTPDAGRQLSPTMFGVVAAGYHARGGKAPALPGRSTLSPSGRVDLRLAVDRAGELYLLTKSDGMIRAVRGAVRLPPSE